MKSFLVRSLIVSFHLFVAHSLWADPTTPAPATPTPTPAGTPVAGPGNAAGNNIDPSTESSTKKHQNRPTDASAAKTQYPPTGCATFDGEIVSYDFKMQKDKEDADSAEAMGQTTSVVTNTNMSMANVSDAKQTGQVANASTASQGAATTGYVQCVDIAQSALNEFQRDRNSLNADMKACSLSTTPVEGSSSTVAPAQQALTNMATFQKWAKVFPPYIDKSVQSSCAAKADSSAGVMGAVFTAATYAAAIGAGVGIGALVFSGKSSSGSSTTAKKTTAATTCPSGESIDQTTGVCAVLASPLPGGGVGSSGAETSSTTSTTGNTPTIGTASTTTGSAITTPTSTGNLAGSTASSTGSSVPTVAAMASPSGSSASPISSASGAGQTSSSAIPKAASLSASYSSPGGSGGSAGGGGAANAQAPCTWNCGTGSNSVTGSSLSEARPISASQLSALNCTGKNKTSAQCLKIAKANQAAKLAAQKNILNDNLVNSSAKNNRSPATTTKLMQLKPNP